MKALAWHGTHDVRVDTIPDPTIEQPTDAIIRVTSCGICGSDLHLYEVLGPFIGPPTEHVRIPRGRGLCGRAVREEKDLNVGDVASQPEYLACSADDRTDLIVLVRDRGEIVGQIDIDSREAGRFSPEHEARVRAVAEALGPLVRLARDADPA